MKQQIIDLSYALDAATPPFPGDPPVEIEVQAAIPADHPPGTPAGSLNVGRLHTGLHVGTHMDAPFHFYHAGRTIDQVALVHFVGPALLINLARKAAKAEIAPAELLPYQAAIIKTRRIILNTGWASHWGQADYFTDYPVISATTAQLLVSWGVTLVGIDTPSVDVYPYPVHFALLGNDILIVENLTNLDRIQPAQFEFIAVPLKITARDASPVRALAIVKED
ncbi:cyclase family protein [soil metagenome]